MRGRTVVAVLASVLAVLVVQFASPTRIARAGDESDPVAAWDSDWRGALDETVRVHADFCVAWSSECARSVATARLRILRIDPEHEATRTALGYVRAKGEAGAPVWTRSEPAREKIRRLSDRWPEETASLAAILRRADAAAAAKFAALGRSAEERADAGGGAAWTERARRAWRTALLWDRENEAANRAIGSPKFEGRFCDPGDVAFFRARQARRIAGEEEMARTSVPEDVPIPAGSPLDAAGLTRSAFATPNVRLETSLDRASAFHLAWNADSGARLLARDFGPSSASADAVRAARIYVVRNAGEARTLLEKGASWKAADVERALGAKLESGCIGSGAWFVAGETRDELEDRTIGVLVRIALGASEGGADPSVEATWIERGVADDLRSRLDGMVVPFPSGHGVKWPRGPDKAFALARRMVETDDDVPLAGLASASEEARSSPRWAAKARAFVQFLFERDAAAARAFISGTKTGQPEGAEALDAEYRRWVVETL